MTINEKLPHRRKWSRDLIATALLATSGSTCFAHRSKSRPPRLLLRSSWQTVNIGDIAHTPGVIAILERFYPEAEIRLWPSNVGNGVETMLRNRFPKLEIVKGNERIDAAFRDCDFLIHGSGPSLVAERDVVRWSNDTGKPYGIFGITFSKTPSTSTHSQSDNTLSKTIDVLSRAQFVFFRDSVSLDLAKAMGCTCPIMEFGPDGAFATDVRDDGKANHFLQTHGLESGKFMCCIPRLRYTPYWTIPGDKRPFSAEKHRRNEQMKEQDCSPLREAILGLIQNTDLKILLCPEDETQMAVNREMIYDRLPESVRSRCVWRENFWLTPEALSTYTQSAGLFGHEMHSPIICIGNGIPAIVCRWAEQTSKGLMWKDIGLQDWLFDFDREEDRLAMPSAVLKIAQNPTEAREIAEQSRKLVVQRQQAMVAILRDAILRETSR